MLIEANHVVNGISKYQCDMCQKLLTAKTVYKLSVTLPKGNPRKQFDLCADCCKKVLNSVKNYKLKHLKRKE